MEVQRSYLRRSMLLCLCVNICVDVFVTAIALLKAAMLVEEASTWLQFVLWHCNCFCVLCHCCQGCWMTATCLLLLNCLSVYLFADTPCCCVGTLQAR